MALANAGVLKHRWLIYELVLRDLRLRYRGSLLGFAWTLLNPVIFMAIYTLVFSVYLHVQVPHYAMYLLAGLIPWGWLSGAVSAGTSSILDGRFYVGKTQFPTIVLVAVPVVSNAVNFLLSLPILALLAVLMHIHWGLPLLFLPLLILVELTLVSGIVLLLATANVFYRDVQQLMTYGLTAMMYLTPIFYLRDQVPAAFRPLIVWNPLAALMGAYQDVLYANTVPSASDMAYALIFGLVLLAIAYGTFVRVQESFSQYL
jgi:ABC-type polysaccharide/polyol phosphate export permease